MVVAVMPTNPVLGLGLAFGSHFILDLIPHYDYRILSLDHEAEKGGVVKMTFSKNFIFDLGRIGLDAVVGLAIAMGIVYFFELSNFTLLILGGAILGMLPDFLQFVNGKVNNYFLSSLQKFHNFFHTKHKLVGWPVAGFISQTVFVLAVVLLFSLSQ